MPHADRIRPQQATNRQRAIAINSDGTQRYTSVLSSDRLIIEPPPLTNLTERHVRRRSESRRYHRNHRRNRNTSTHNASRRRRYSSDRRRKLMYFQNIRKGALNAADSRGTSRHQIVSHRHCRCDRNRAPTPRRVQRHQSRYQKVHRRMDQRRRRIAKLAPHNICSRNAARYRLHHPRRQRIYLPHGVRVTEFTDCAHHQSRRRSFDADDIVHQRVAVRTVSTHFSWLSVISMIEGDRGILVLICCARISRESPTKISR